MAWLLRPFYRAIWGDPRRRAHKLLQFAEVEADGGRDLVRAAERTADPLLRGRLLAHARDEARHAAMFRARGLALGALHPSETGPSPTNWASTDWIAPGERGFDRIDFAPGKEGALLAFVHLSERAAARDFAAYRSVLENDPPTAMLFGHILRDEEHHMQYSLDQLHRIAPAESKALLWQARARRLWKAYLRLAGALDGVIAGALLTIQYFVLLPPFALAAKRAARREKPGWMPISATNVGQFGREF